MHCKKSHMGNQSSCGLVPEYILPSWKEYSLGLKGGCIPTREDIKSQTNIYWSRTGSAPSYYKSKYPL